MEKEKRGLMLTAGCLIFAVLFIIFGFMYLRIKDLQTRLTELERGTSEAISEHQGQLDSLNNNIKGLWKENDSISEAVSNLDEKINETRSIQHNTNQALSRLRKQKDELEKKLEEGLELRRQRLAEMQARWSAPSNGWSDIGSGVFELTAYAWTGNPCANGEYPVEGYTVASNYYPIGTRLWIEGIGERVVTDTGGMSNNVIDIYMGDEETCIQFGRQSAEVYVIEE